MKNKSFVLSIILILLATLIPGKSVPTISHSFQDLPLDKLGHFIMFFYLGINITRSITNIKLKVAAIILGIFLGITTELLQQFIPGRNLEFMDGIMDTLGVIIGAAIYPRLKFMKENLRL